MTVPGHRGSSAAHPGRAGWAQPQTKAPRPVIARPVMRVLISRVPS